MRIACPSCDATYDVPDRLLAGPARSLRCSRCGVEFALPGVAAVTPPPEPPPPEAPRAAEPAPPPAPAARPEPPPSRELAPLPDAPSAALVRAWVASVVVVAAAVTGFFVFHDTVMDVWPASARLFAALGLA